MGSGGCLSRRRCGRLVARLNSCSGEVWPRGVGAVALSEVTSAVSILVLVKYGLGGVRDARHEVAQRLVSILVLVKYGLGAAGGDDRRVRRTLVSILVLVKYGLGASRTSQ